MSPGSRGCCCLCGRLVELAVWLDGQLYLHYTGMRWRSTEAVKIKRVTLLVYVHAARRDNTVWYDDLVVSTGCVGTR
jgi:hypothetical protein